MAYLWQTHLGVADGDFDTSYHDKPRSEILPLIKESPGRILDIGCAGGATGRLLRSLYPDCSGIGVELNARAAEQARSVYGKVISGNVEDAGFLAEHLEPASVDTVLLLDVLEHTYNPWQILVNLKPYLSARGRIIASIPNAFNVQLLEMLAGGRWSYDKWGLLDITHIRFFALPDMIDLFTQTGYAVRSCAGVPHPPSMLPRGVQRTRDGLATEHLVLRNIPEQRLNELLCIQHLLVAEPQEAVRPAAAAPKPAPAPAVKPGRNQPCPCGSGKRYKDCCGALGAQPPVAVAPAAPAARSEQPPAAAGGVPQLMFAALDQQRRGALAEARRLYLEALDLEPKLPDALHMLGVIAYTEKRYAEAEEFILKARELMPGPDKGVEHNLTLVRDELFKGQHRRSFCQMALGAVRSRLRDPAGPVAAPVAEGLDVVADLADPGMAATLAGLAAAAGALGLPGLRLWHNGGGAVLPSMPADHRVIDGRAGRFPKGDCLLFLGTRVGASDWLESATPKPVFLYCESDDACRLLDAIEGASFHGRHPLTLFYRDGGQAEAFGLPGVALSPTPVATGEALSTDALRTLLQQIFRIKP